MEHEHALLNREGDTQDLVDRLDRFRLRFDAMRQQIGQVIVGQQQIVDLALTALIVGGHVLLEGVPGVGKTGLVRSLAAATGTHFSRVQFTPDLMPADLLGTNVLLETGEGTRYFEFQRGPIFGNVLLADEINRATPKTQSALLEAMQERSVTIAGQTHALPALFFVMATQNPLEMEGTYPLPEAQLDRFLFKLRMGYPSPEEMELILERTTESSEPHVTACADLPELLQMANLARQIPIARTVRRAAIDLVMRTRPHDPTASEMVQRYVRYGASPRGAQAIILAGKVRAILQGRHHVARDDLWAVAPAALRHRLILNLEAHADRMTSDEVIASLLED